MENYIVYHNPRCTKSRCALQYLDDKKIKYDVIEYLKDTFSKEELKHVLSLLKIPAEELVRKGEEDYKENFKGKFLSEDEWVDAMLEFPKLIERPIVVHQNKAIVARPTEKIDLLK